MCHSVACNYNNMLLCVIVCVGDGGRLVGANSLEMIIIIIDTQCHGYYMRYQ